MIMIIVSHSMPMGSGVQDPSQLANNRFFWDMFIYCPTVFITYFFFFFDKQYSSLTVAWNLTKLIKRNPKGKNEKKKLEIRYGITWKLSKESEAHKIHFPFGNGVACRVGLKTLNSTVNTKVWMTQLQKSIGEETVKKEKRNHAEPSLKTPKTQQKKKKKGTNIIWYIWRNVTYVYV